MKQILSVATFMLAAVLPVQSQSQSVTRRTPNCDCCYTEPRTKLATFEYATDSVIIKARSVIGMVRGVTGDTVRIEYDIFTNITTGQKEFGDLTRRLAPG